jgi:hypothetical protein
MRLSTHLVLSILSNPRIYIVVLLYKSLSNPNISIGLYRLFFSLSRADNHLCFINVRMCLFLCSAHIELVKKYVYKSEMELLLKVKWHVAWKGINDIQIRKSTFALDISSDFLKFVFILLDIGPAPRNFLLDPLNFCRTYIFSSPDPKGSCELLSPLSVCRPSSVR